MESPEQGFNAKETSDKTTFSPLPDHGNECAFAKIEHFNVTVMMTQWSVTSMGINNTGSVTIAQGNWTICIEWLNRSDDLKKWLKEYPYRELEQSNRASE
jgi:hypothetical protein